MSGSGCGDRLERPGRGSAVELLAALVLLSGCQELGGGASTPTETAPSPTDVATPTATESPSETATEPVSATPTPRPDISPRRVAELTRFTERVDFDTPATGEWEFLGPQTVRYRTTSDFEIRDQYGSEGDPPPEAIAREMVDAPDIAPETVIIEVVSEDGEFLDEFNVTDEMATGLEEYQLSPGDFVNVTTETGDYSKDYFDDGGSPLVIINIDELELRGLTSTAPLIGLKRTRAMLSDILLILDCIMRRI